MGRRFTHRQRTELWLAAEGKCAICGKDLTEFHVDHIKPWSHGGATINENGQVTCPECNVRKGERMLRSHQQQFLEACQQMKAEETLRKIVALVCPGGGKSAYPVITAHELIPAIGDHIAWIVPRINLCDQGEYVFLDDWLRRILGHSNEIRKSVNAPDLLRGKIGYVTTYQALIAARSYRENPHEALFKKKRMILILDEPQHLADAGDFEKAIKPLKQLSSALIMMSGGLTRHDNQQISFLDYLERDASGRMFVDLRDSQAQKVIKYGLAEATREHAIIKIDFKLSDATADWDDVIDDGELLADRIETFNGASQVKTKKALFTALATEYFETLLRDAAMFWLDRRRYNPRSKFLVVAPFISHAKRAEKILTKMGITCGIATSDETDASDTIEKFRDKQQPHLDALVTVAMAYEGLDAPAADVLACLTHIRSREWIEQMIHRITRFDKDNRLPWEHQFATVFAPKDRFFVDIMGEIKAEQAPFVTEVLPPPPPPPPPPKDHKTFARQSERTDTSCHSLNDEPPINSSAYLQLHEALRAADIHGAISMEAAKKFSDALTAVKPDPFDLDNLRLKTEPVPPSKREAALRKQIVDDQREGYKPSDPKTHERIERRGKEIWKITRKPLIQCTEAELQNVWRLRSQWMVP